MGLFIFIFIFWCVCFKPRHLNIGLTIAYSVGMKYNVVFQNRSKCLNYPRNIPPNLKESMVKILNPFIRSSLEVYSIFSHGNL